MQFPLSENRIANYGKVSSYLPALTCQQCHSLSLQQVICLKCHENLCFKCIQIQDDKIPEPFEKTIETELVAKTTKYIPDQNYRGYCPFCETMTILSSTIPKLFHRLYTNVKFQCVNRVSGCPEELCYPDLRIHETKCGFIKLTCPKQECGQSTFRKDWQQHLSVCNPKIECICGTTFRESSQHTQQSCLKNQCDLLKSQITTQNKELQTLRENNNNSLSFSSPQKMKSFQPSSPYTASPFSLQGLLQQSAQLMNEQ